MSMLGRKHTEEAKRKIGKAQKGNKNGLGYKHTEEAKKRISKGSKGNKYSLGKHWILSKETKTKMSIYRLNKKQKYGFINSEETRQKISEANKGKHLTEETKKKMSEAHLRRKQKNGYINSPETRRKLSEANKGEKSHTWKGGITPATTKRTSSLEWRILSKETYKRDNWICQKCGKHCQGKDIQCHHIVPHRITNNDSSDNLTTLCRSCHMKEDWKYNKKQKGQQEFSFV